jgi:hypothetical protein
MLKDCYYYLFIGSSRAMFSAKKGNSLQLTATIPDGKLAWIGWPTFLRHHVGGVTLDGVVDLLFQIPAEPQKCGYETHLERNTSLRY